MRLLKTLLIGSALTLIGSALAFGFYIEASEAIFVVFEKCCRYIASHSQPLETLNVRPSMSDLQADWKAVEDAMKKYTG